MSRTALMLGVLVAMFCGLSLVACGLFGTDVAKLDSPHAPGSASATHRITQLDFAREARYAHCVEPACPTVTSKTLAALPAPAASRVVPQAIAQTASAAPGRDTTPPPSTLLTTPAPHTLVLHFRINSAALTTAHKALLRDALADLQRTDRIVIAGRTDDLGSEALNQSLAFARALAIRDHLLDLAPDLPARISIDAKGRCCYAVANDTEPARAQNRRVEISFTPRTGRTP
ncbi:OmpA family protein [Sphaerotilus sp.]|uniref:OmpA family protein n=1 Tax=Sphaerotilus sp. TaxID=2093942 RepID=UPI002ACE928A|nr:OmpA family protein [Sphaerotilus sp.]MDZ7855930.1 OmpA family protein [Sphaerotilus sp.]